MFWILYLKKNQFITFWRNSEWVNLFSMSESKISIILKHRNFMLADELSSYHQRMFVCCILLNTLNSEIKKKWENYWMRNIQWNISQYWQMNYINFRRNVILKLIMNKNRLDVFEIIRWSLYFYIQFIDCRWKVRPTNFMMFKLAQFKIIIITDYNNVTVTMEHFCYDSICLFMV